MTLEPGTLLYNRYKIEEVIAHGGMGAIYRATDQSLGVSVAVKENLFSSEEFSRQFHREATLLAGLRHPNLPRVTDHFTITGQGQYLVMDFIDGEDLRQMLSRQGVLSEEEGVFIAAEVCDALSYLHARQPAIIHRDIKPGNIKVTSSGQIHLVDFGLAKISQPGQATTTGAQALTPGYAPPEQYGKGTDSRSDIYALGATLYAALTGKVPEDSLARAMGSAELTPPQQYNPVLSNGISAVMLRSMAIDPKQRYETAEDFKQALLNACPQARRRITRNGPAAVTGAAQIPQASSTASATRISKPLADVSSQPTSVLSAPVQSAPEKKKIPAWLWVGAGVLALAFILVISGAIWAFSRGSAAITPTAQAVIANVDATRLPVVLPAEPTTEPTLTTAPEPTEQPAATVTPESDPTAAPVPTEAAASAPTAVPPAAEASIAFASDRSGSVQIWVMDSEGKNLRQVTNLADGACQPDWSPDGQKIAGISPCNQKKEVYERSNLFIINADGSGLQYLPSLPGGDFEPAWSPDGSQILFTSLRERSLHIFSINLADKSVKRITPASSVDRQPAWSADGTSIAFKSSRLGKPQIWIMDSEGKSPHEFTRFDGSEASMPTWSPDGSVIVFSQGSNQPWLAAQQTNSPQAKDVTLNDRIRPALDASYSNDGVWIIFDFNKDNKHQVFRMSPNGAQVTSLSDGTANDFDPISR